MVLCRVIELLALDSSPRYKKSDDFHQFIRHLFLIFMIALLPLRGWISDAMATGMVAAQMQQQTATEIVADHETMVAQADMATADCSGHDFGEKAHAADTLCESCSACQACHTIAVSPTATGVSAAFNLCTLTGAVVAQFSSAEHAPGKKPPIS
jgi:hypothetical protein